MSHEPPIAELRSACNTPSPESWERLCELLESWPHVRRDVLLEQVLPYCHDHVSRWPHEIQRSAPNSWLKRLFFEPATTDTIDTSHLLCLCSHIQTHDVWRQGPWDVERDAPRCALPLLATHLDCASAWHPEPLTMLLQTPAPRLKTLRLHAYHPTASVAHALRHCLWFHEALESLEVCICDGPGPENQDLMFQVFESRSLPHLRELDLGGTEGKVGALAFLALLDAAQSSEQLVSIFCSSAWLTFDAAEVLATHRSLRNVTRLDMSYNMYIGFEGVELLRNSPYLTQEVRRCLDLDYDDIFE